MTYDDASGPWHDLAQELETRCRDINAELLAQRRSPVAFDVDAGRRLLLMLRDAKRPVPTLKVTVDQDAWDFVFRWPRLGGEAWLSITNGPQVNYQAILGRDTLVDAYEETFSSHDFGAFFAALDHFTLLKQVLVVRRDLKMRQGKAVSQGSHASGEFMREQIMAALDGGALAFSDDEIEWMTQRMAKITVRTDTDEQFRQVADDARARGLKVRVITDAGHTEFHGVPTVTALAIGPTRSAYVDPITGGLTLL